MALVYVDRVQETTLTIGTGALTLLGPVTGYQSFITAGAGNQVYYVITDETTGDWEVGQGTVGVGSLSRDSVLASSNANALVSLSPGSKLVFATSPAQFFTNALSATSHAAINHTGLPGVPAPEAFTAGVHAVTDHTGLPGVPAAEAFTALVHAATSHTGLPGIEPPIPTVDGWTANTETLAGTKTLTDASPTIQFLNPGASDRLVRLPAVTGDNRLFVIHNTGTVGGQLQVISGSTIVGNIRPLGMSRFYSDGVRWVMSPAQVSPSSGLRSLGYLKFYTSGSINPGFAAGINLRAHAAGQILGGFQGVTADGGGSTFTITVNAVDQGSAQAWTLTSSTPSAFTLGAPISFSAGDIIDFRNSGANVVFNGVLLVLIVRYTDSPAATVMFSADSLAGGTPVYALRGGSALATTEQIDSRTCLVVPEACKVVSASWNYSGSVGPSTLAIYRNGLTTSSTFGSGLTGSSNLSFPLQRGDVISIRAGSAGTISGGILTLLLDWPGLVVRYGGNTTGSNITTVDGLATWGGAGDQKPYLWKAPANGRIRYATGFLPTVAATASQSEIRINGSGVAVLPVGPARRVADLGLPGSEADAYVIELDIPVSSGDLVTVYQPGTIASSVALWFLTE